MVSASATPLLHRDQALFHGEKQFLAFLEVALLDAIGSMA